MTVHHSSLFWCAKYFVDSDKFLIIKYGPVVNFLKFYRFYSRNWTTLVLTLSKSGWPFKILLILITADRCDYKIFSRHNFEYKLKCCHHQHHLVETQLFPHWPTEAKLSILPSAPRKITLKVNGLKAFKLSQRRNKYLRKGKKKREYNYK